jgi:hypothetical protein
MDPTKTRIWNADDLGLIAAHDARKADRDSRAQAKSLPPPPPSSRRVRASLPPPPLAADSTSHAATRIMPIERLLAGMRPDADTEAATTVLTTARPTRSRTLKRIAGHVLLATLTVLAIAAWKLPLRQLVRARTPQLSAATSRPASAPPDAAIPAPQPPEVQAVAPPETSKPSRRTKPGALQRRAVELLIAGDYDSAEQAYRTLAAEHPETRSFQEAARILAARGGK